MLKDYSEAIRYFDNAKVALSQTEIDTTTNTYKDEKYVKTACGIAYNGVLKALDIYFSKKNVEPPRKGRKSVEYYTENLAKLNKKHLTNFNVLYKSLHLSGYYDGNPDVKAIKSAMKRAKDLISELK